MSENIGIGMKDGEGEVSFPAQEPLEDQPIHVAHDLSKKIRSADVIVEGKDAEIDFRGLQLSDDIVNGLRNCGFVKPSPIQVHAIPLGRHGFGTSRSPTLRLNTRCFVARNSHFEYRHWFRN
jgi:hypothetical protein